MDAKRLPDSGKYSRILNGYQIANGYQMTKRIVVYWMVRTVGGVGDRLLNDRVADLPICDYLTTLLGLGFRKVRFLSRRSGHGRDGLN